MVYDFIPSFVRSVGVGEDSLIIEVTAEQVDKIIRSLLDRPEFRELVIEYSTIRKSQNRNQMNIKEIELQKTIFPEIWQALYDADKNFVVFTADVGEELFHRFDEREGSVNR